jgi:hypothetical protein
MRQAERRQVGVVLGPLTLDRLAIDHLSTQLGPRRAGWD